MTTDAPLNMTDEEIDLELKFMKLTRAEFYRRHRGKAEAYVSERVRDWPQARDAMADDPRARETFVLAYLDGFLRRSAWECWNVRRLERERYLKVETLREDFPGHKALVGKALREGHSFEQACAAVLAAERGVVYQVAPGTSTPQ